MFFQAGFHLLLFFWPISSASQSLISLDGNDWTLSNPSKAITVPATIPGQVHLDLQRAKVIGDPYFGILLPSNQSQGRSRITHSDDLSAGSNGYNLQWVANDTWVYSSPPLSDVL
jgi:beta-mannosidase